MEKTQFELNENGKKKKRKGMNLPQTVLGAGDWHRLFSGDGAGDRDVERERLVVDV